MKLLTLIALSVMSLLAQAAEPLPPIDTTSPIYEVKVEPGVSYDDVVLSMKTAAEGKNFVSPATFPLGEHMQTRGLSVQGVMEVRSYCNLGLGAEILLDHPEFAVFAPCRIAIYEKQGQLYVALDRPSFDLQYIKNPTERALKAAKELEETLIWIMDKARKGEI
ncbi:MAG: DUF302 domain-containing protein [Methylophilaceae bacterium]